MSIFQCTVVQHKISKRLYRVCGMAAGYIKMISQDEEGNFAGKQVIVGDLWFRLFYKPTDLHAIIGGKPH